jgi:hypothetical protein
VRKALLPKSFRWGDLAYAAGHRNPFGAQGRASGALGTQGRASARKGALGAPLARHAAPEAGGTGRARYRAGGLMGKLSAPSESSTFDVIRGRP